MAYAVIKDGEVFCTRSTKEQCAAEILVKHWCVVERHGTWNVKGVEIVDTDELKTANGGPASTDRT